jgi:threonine synthase
MRALVVMPVDAPDICRRECTAAGAELYLVDGLIGDAGAIVAGEVGGGGWFDVSTLKEPYRLEGKKTMGLEIYEQLGRRVPDVIVYPTGGGVGLIGIHKALGELRELGWLDGPLPRLVAAQATGCAPIVRAFEGGARTAEPFPDAHTVAFGINVANPLGATLILDAIAATGGCAVAVEDDELLAVLAETARLEGAFVCPEGAAGVAAIRRLRESGWIDESDEVVLLNTGAGIKYPDTVAADAPILQPGDALPLR